MADFLKLQSHGRPIRKLRISLTDSCNLRCGYCMPSHPKFMNKNKLLSPKELGNAAHFLFNHGLEQLRITGGEPTLRNDFKDCVYELTRLPWKSIGLTTNGQKLSALLPMLKEYGVQKINISLDTLDEGLFDRLTGGGILSKTMEAISNAVKMGFQVKINTVALKGINNIEFIELLKWSASENVELRFLEMLKMGPWLSKHEQLFLSADQIEKIIQEEFNYEVIPVSHDSTAQRYRTKEGLIFGIIASETRAFCDGCSRMRLTANGKIKACMMLDDECDIRDFMKTENPYSLSEFMRKKPQQRIEQSLSSLYEFGG